MVHNASSRTRFVAGTLPPWCPEDDAPLADPDADISVFGGFNPCLLSNKPILFSDGGEADSTPCRTHMFLSLVSPRSVSHCASHSPLAHMCAWLKTCRGRVCEHQHIHQKSFCLVMFHRLLIDVPDFLFLLHSTSTDDYHTLADRSQVTHKRYSARRVAVWPSGRIQRSHRL